MKLIMIILSCIIVCSASALIPVDTTFTYYQIDGTKVLEGVRWRLDETVNIPRTRDSIVMFIHTGICRFKGDALIGCLYFYYSIRFPACLNGHYFGLAGRSSIDSVFNISTFVRIKLYMTNNLTRVDSVVAMYLPARNDTLWKNMVDTVLFEIGAPEGGEYDSTPPPSGFPTDGSLPQRISYYNMIYRPYEEPDTIPTNTVNRNIRMIKIDSHNWFDALGRKILPMRKKQFVFRAQ